MIRVVLPGHLRTLAGIDGEVAVHVEPPVTLPSVLDALEQAHPNLAGLVRDRTTRTRRPMIRLFGDGQDLSDLPEDRALPDAVASGREPLLVVGAIAGG